MEFFTLGGKLNVSGDKGLHFEAPVDGVLLASEFNLSNMSVAKDSQIMAAANELKVENDFILENNAQFLDATTANGQDGNLLHFPGDYAHDGLTFDELLNVMAGKASNAAPGYLTDEELQNLAFDINKIGALEIGGDAVIKENARYEANGNVSVKGKLNLTDSSQFFVHKGDATIYNQGDTKIEGIIGIDQDHSFNFEKGNISFTQNQSNLLGTLAINNLGTTLSIKDQDLSDRHNLGMLLIDQGATLNAAGTNNLSNLHNKGAIYIGSAVEGSENGMLTVNGNYIGEDGSVLYFGNLNAMKEEYSNPMNYGHKDLLWVKGDAFGNSEIRFTENAKLSNLGFITDKGILLAQIDGQSSLDLSMAADQRLTDGGTEYTLVGREGKDSLESGKNSWYLSNEKFDGTLPLTPIDPIKPSEPLTPLEPATPIKPSEPLTPLEPATPIEPSEPLTPLEPATPIKPSEPLTPLEPATPIKPSEPLIPFEPATPIEPSEPLTPLEPATPIEPSEPLTPLEPATPIKPSEPLTPLEPATPIEPSEPLTPLEPATPIEPSEPLTPLEPATPIKPSEPLTPLEPATPIKPSEPLTPLEPATPIEPSEPLTPLEPATPIEPSEPLTPLEPATPIKPSEPLTPLEPATPIEPSEPLTPLEPATPIEPSEPLTPLEPATPIEPSEPLTPLEPATPIKPSEPLTPLEPAKPVVYIPEASAYLANLIAANEMYTLKYHEKQYLTGYDGVWSRLKGSFTNFNLDNDHDLGSNIDMFTLHLGRDLWHEDKLTLGVMAAYGYTTGSSHNNYNGKKADHNSQGFALGAYGSYEFNENSYIDTWVQYVFMRNKVTGFNAPEQKYNLKGLTASVEAGYAFEVNDTFRIQPQAQFIWMGVKNKNHTDSRSTKIGSDSNNLQSRIGVRFYSEGDNYIPFAEVNYIHNSKKYNVNFEGELNSNKFTAAGSKNLYRLELGMTTKPKNDWTASGSISYTQGGSSYRNTSFKIDLRYDF